MTTGLDATSTAPSVRLGLLRGFELRRRDSIVGLPLSAQRVLAFVALHDRPLQRLFVAGNLWLDTTEERANACLRTALWRLGQLSCPLVDSTSSHLALAEGVWVDVRETKALARRLLRSAPLERAEELDDLCGAGELLPDWYDDWVLIERERFRQLRLHALESLCEELTGAGRFAEAAEAGLAAVEAEVLRESAHRVLIKAYLAEGNPSEAIRQYRFFRDVLKTQLGLDPSPLLTELMGSLPIR